MIDLIYDVAAKFEIHSKFPQAKFRDTSAFLREGRMEVELECPEDDWYRFLIKSGIGNISFSFQIALVMETDRIAKLMDEVKPGWRDRSMKKRQEVQQVDQKRIKMDRRAIFGEPPEGVKLTKQGIRDLDAIGPKQSLNKREKVHDQATCSHDFRISEDQHEHRSFDGFTPHTSRCVKCGKKDEGSAKVMKL